MKFESKVAVFNYEESDADLIKDLAKYLDNNSQKVLDFFGISGVPKKAVINIIPTKEELDQKYRKCQGFRDDVEIHKWMIGFCSNDGINYLSLNDYKNTTHKFEPSKKEQAILYFKKTIVHEYVHFVHRLYCGKYFNDPWLSEGIAEYLSGQNDGEKIEPLSATKEQILGRKKIYYFNDWLLVKYFIENYDHEFVLDVLKDPEKAKELLDKELYDRAFEFYKNK